MSHPRDPRLRRQHAHLMHGGHPPVDALTAAVRLDLAADAMRAQQLEHGPSPAVEEIIRECPPDPELVRAVESGPQANARLRAEVAAVAQQLEPPVGEWTCESCGEQTDALPCRACSTVVEPPASSVAPSAPAPAFSSERSGPALDWRSRHDPRSLDYGVRGRLRGSAPLADRLWPSDWPTLDQGAEGACVGMAVAGWANTMRAGADWLTGVDAMQLYDRAQELDEVPGENYSGTSVLAGMQAGVEAGLFGGYLWAFGTKDIAQAVLQRGPVVIGIPWLAGMYKTGLGGLVRVEGADVGGHALVVVGLRLKGPQGQPGPFFVWHNSWGDDYGDAGLGYVHHRDLAALLRGRGEAAIPTVEKVIP